MRQCLWVIHLGGTEYICDYEAPVLKGNLGTAQPRKYMICASPPCAILAHGKYISDYTPVIVGSVSMGTQKVRIMIN